jgi:hypothetical protein
MVVAFRSLGGEEPRIFCCMMIHDYFQCFLAGDVDKSGQSVIIPVLNELAWLVVKEQCAASYILLEILNEVPNCMGCCLTV